MEKQGRDFRLEALARQRDDEWVHQNMYGGELRVHGLIMFGVRKGSMIGSLQFGNESIVDRPIPAHIFQNDDVVTLEEAQRLLERGSFPMLKRNQMQGYLHTGNLSRVMFERGGGCESVAFLIERMSVPAISQKSVKIVQNGDKWIGRITEDTLVGELTTLNIEAESEMAVVSAITAALTPPALKASWR